MSRKGFFTVALIGLVCAALFGGGGNDRNAGSGSSVGGPVKLTVAMTENLRIKDYETNVMTKLLEGWSNTDLDFLLFPSTDYINKINLMVMAGGQELPDIIMARPGDAMVYQWAKEGVILPLTKYYNDPKLSPHLHEAMERTDDFRPLITSPDGNIYGIPAYNQFYGSEFSHKLWIYKPWLDKLGGKIPETTDEFKTLLRRVVSTDLNGNGRADEIGIDGLFSICNPNGPQYAGWFNYLMNSFLYADDENFVVENGMISAPYIKPEWREGLKYIRSLIADKSIPLETLTQDANQVRTLLNTPDVRAFAFSMTSPSGVNDSNPAAHEYVSIPPLKGPRGVQYATYRPLVPNIGMMITSNCKDVDAAFRVGDNSAREEIGIIQRFGERGVDWDYPQDIPNWENSYVTYLEGWPAKMILYNDMRFWGGTLVFNSSWRQQGPYVCAYDVNHGRRIPPAELEGRAGNVSKSITLYDRDKYAPKEVIPKLIYNEDENEIISETLATLNSYVSEMTSNFLAGNRDIDTTWNAYINEVNNIGLPKVIGVMQKVYDRMYK
jgi:putative aldouronate transport system substrate-binding protein